MNGLLSNIARIAASGYASALIFITMLAYVINARFFGGEGVDVIMLGMAIVLTFQAVWSLLYRLFYLLKGRVPYVHRGADVTGADLDITKAKLIEAGLTREMTYGEGVMLARNGSRSLIFETMAYLALLFTIGMGMANYGYALNARFMVFPAQNWKSLYSYVDESLRGPLIKPEMMPQEITVRNLKPDDASQPSSIDIVFRSSEEGQETTRTFVKGDVMDLGHGVMMRYLGDMYIPFLTFFKLPDETMEVRMDYQPRSRPLRYDSSLGLYATDVPINHEGASGNLTYSPSDNLFHMTAFINGTLTYDRTYEFPGYEEDGGFSSSVMSMGHFGEFDVWRPPLRPYIYTGIGLVFLCMALRMVFRPAVALLWTDSAGITHAKVSPARLKRLINT